MGGMKKVALFTGMGSATTKIVGRGGLCDGGQVQDFKSGVVRQEVTHEVVDVNPLHDDHNAGGLLVVRPGHQR